MIDESLFTEEQKKEIDEAVEKRMQELHTRIKQVKEESETWTEATTPDLPLTGSPLLSGEVQTTSGEDSPQKSSGS